MNAMSKLEFDWYMVFGGSLALILTAISALILIETINRNVYKARGK